MTHSTLEQCKTAVNTYLDSQKDVSPDTSITVASGDTVTLHYIGRFENGEIFDTSIESVAKACGLYREGPEAQEIYTKGLSFVAGAGQVVPGFDAAVLGMHLNETKTTSFGADQAYGGATITLPKGDNFPAEYKAGDEIPTAMGMIKILDMTDTEITIENNHPLAGKALTFDITIKGVTKQ